MLFREIIISVIGAYCEEYISDLFRRGIRLRKVYNKGGVIYARVRRRDYRTIAALSRSYGVRVRVEKRVGLRLRAGFLSKRKGLVLGVIFTAFAILTLQRFLWHIEIHGNDQLSDSFILKQLEARGITIGAYTGSLNTNKAELKIMRAVDKIGWINIEVNGSRADVYLNETSFPEEPEIPLSSPCNVVAGKSGTIVDTEVYSGQLLYPKGSGVAEGSIIVSGTVNDGGGNILLTHANAKIIAEFSEHAEFSMNYTTEEKQPTGKTETEQQLMILGVAFPLYSEPVSRENKICSEEIKTFSLFGAEMPIKIKTDTFTEYETVTVTRKMEDVERLLTQKLELYCLNMFSDYEIVDIKKSVKRTEEGITLGADIKLRGNIAVQQEIYSRQ
ncbi:MAG: sporulation protein YqfD [Ruminiclostridium sp.]